MRLKSWIWMLNWMSLSGLAVGGESEGGLLARVFGDQEARIVSREQLEVDLSVEDYLGRDMVNDQGERLGKVVDLTIENQSGRFKEAVISVGGVLSFGDVLVAVPYDKVRHVTGTSDLVWDIPRAKFESLVHSAKKHGPNLADTKTGRSKGAGLAPPGATVTDPNTVPGKPAPTNQTSTHK